MGSNTVRSTTLWIGTLCLVAGGMTACQSEPKLLPGKTTQASVSLSPSDDTQDLPVSTELGITVDKGETTQVTVEDSDGTDIPGTMRDDDSAWVPREPLDYDTSYTAKVTAEDGDGIPASATTSFHTMSEPKQKVSATVWNDPKYEYGQAMTVQLDFEEGFEVDEDHREAVENRLFVSSEPKQEGAWHWFDGNHLEYRTKEFWEPGTTISLRAALEGVPLGDGKYGSEDLEQDIQVSDIARKIEVNDDDKEMVAYKDGKEVKSMPVSLGKASTPSYSGTMTVMEKLEHTIFDTTAQCGGKVQGSDCYRTPVDWAQRLTWSGQFIHSAPWSVGDQGSRNVSHGCVNASPQDSKWIFNFAAVGDPVIVNGTGTKLPYGDGFTAFDLSWEEYLEGSYATDVPSDASADSD